MFSNNSIGVTLSSYYKDQRIETSEGYGQSIVGDEPWLESTVANKGPVSVCIYVDSNFQNYNDGSIFFFTHSAFID